MSSEEYTRPTSTTRFFVASAIWAAVIIPLAWLSSTFLSIPGAFGAGYFWLPQMAMPTGAYFFGPWGWLSAAVGTFFGGMLAGSPLLINIAQNPIPAFLANAVLFWFLLKVYAVILIIFWVRGTFPRLRIDQLMGFAWKVMVPLSFLTIVITAVYQFYNWPAWSLTLMSLAGLVSVSFLIYRHLTKPAHRVAEVRARQRALRTSRDALAGGEGLNSIPEGIPTDKARD